MYRTGFIIVMLLAVAVGLVVGTLNHAVVPVDLLWVQLNWPLGLVLLLALVTGVALGVLLVMLFSVLPLRMRLRRARQKQPQDGGNPPVANP